MSKAPHNTPGPKRAKSAPPPVEPIPAGQFWPLKLFHLRCGYGDRALAGAIKLGLPVYRWGRRSWISTDDLIAFLMREGVKGDVGDQDDVDGPAVECEPDSKSADDHCFSNGKPKRNGRLLPEALQTEDI